MGLNIKKILQTAIGGGGGFRAPKNKPVPAPGESSIVDLLVFNSFPCLITLNRCNNVTDRSLTSNVPPLPLPLAARCRRTPLTFYTTISRLQVRDQVFGTGLYGMQGGVRDGEVALSPSRTPSVRIMKNISRAADIIIPCEASAEPHPPIGRPFHQNHLILGARSIERLPTVFMVLAGLRIPD